MSTYSCITSSTNSSMIYQNECIKYVLYGFVIIYICNTKARLVISKHSTNAMITAGKQMAFYECKKYNHGVEWTISAWTPARIKSNIYWEVERPQLERLTQPFKPWCNASCEPTEQLTCFAKLNTNMRATSHRWYR